MIFSVLQLYTVKKLRPIEADIKVWFPLGDKWRYLTISLG